MSESIEASLVRVRTTNGGVIGAGFLVGERTILTCAHVIVQALDWSDPLIAPAQTPVTLDFPFLNPHQSLNASIVLWQPVREDGSGDIAVLELLDEPPVGSKAACFVQEKDVWEHPFRAFGFPNGYDHGVWATGRLLGRQANNWLMIEDIKVPGLAITPGFSGTPVWDTQLQGVVGMVVASSRVTETKTAFVLPADVLLRAWPSLAVFPKEPRNPYKGLRSFRLEDARDFFGREQLIETALERLKGILSETVDAPGKRLLTLIGASGAGKSSLVMAGLLPKLQAGALPESQDWVYLEPMTPGNHPLEALLLTLAAQFPAQSLAALREDLNEEAGRGLHLLASRLMLRSGGQVVLYIDQFEELFTQTTSEEERQRFITLLLTAIQEPRGPLLVLLTMRADFYDRPMRYPNLYRMVDAHHLSVLAMQEDDLRCVIEQPAILPDVQLTFEGDLASQLLFEMRGQSGALPLLSFTLDQLFVRRRGRELTMQAYREMGGVKGALSLYAEKIYTTLPSEHYRALTRTLFLRLVDLGLTDQDITRRRAVLSEFTFARIQDTQAMASVLRIYINARLLTTSTYSRLTLVEVSHDAVLREWKRLVDWLREAFEDVRLQKALIDDALEWKKRGQPTDRLYRGSQLTEALAWEERNLPSSTEEEFLHASVVERERQRKQEKERQLQEQRQRNRYTRRMVLLGLAGVTTTALAISGATYIIATRKSPLQPITLPYSYVEHTGTVLSVAWSPDGNRLASAGEDKRVRVWDARTGETLLPLYKGITDFIWPVASVAWSPDGKRLASGGGDIFVSIWEIGTEKPALVCIGHLYIIHSVAWSSDGKRLASAGLDKTVRIWDSSTGKLLFTYKGHLNKVLSVAWSPDGKWLASAGLDKTVQIWDASTGKSIFTCTGHTGDVASVAWSPDGKRLASASRDQTARVWDVPTGESLLTYQGHSIAVTSVAWSPDGKRLASAGGDMTVQIWDARSGNTFRSYKGHTNYVWGVAWSPNGKLIASAGGDKTVQLWNPNLLVYRGHKSVVYSAAWSPDGKYLASSGEDRTAQVWDANTGETIFIYEHTDNVLSVAWSPDSKRLASASLDKTVRIWDVSSRKALLTYRGHTDGVLSVAWSPDGKRLASAGNDHTVQVWDATTGTTLLTYKKHKFGQLPIPVLRVAWSPDGKRLASGGRDTTIQVWDASTGATILTHRMHKYDDHALPTLSVAWSPDGKWLASAGQQRIIQVWDASTGNTVLTYTKHTDQVRCLSWSPDGKRLASGSMDRSVQVWNASTGNTLLTHTEQKEAVLSVTWAPDDKRLASASYDRTVQVWLADLG